MKTDKYIDSTGDVVQGDVIHYLEAVFEGSHRRPRFAGDRTIHARVVRESYGAATGQHTFTLQVIDSVGTDAIKAGTQIRRKGRNVYRNGTRRRLWTDENTRGHVADEKHTRGRSARTEKMNKA